MSKLLKGSPRKKKTHCKRGHEFTPENTRMCSDGSRACRTCHHEHYLANREVIIARSHQWKLNNRERAREASRKYQARVGSWYTWSEENRQRNNAQRREQHHTRRRDLGKYGMTKMDYDRMFLEQGGKCAVCRRTEEEAATGKRRNRRLHVDHDHRTGKVRALLCGDCNGGLGLLRDNPELVREAANYIELHSGFDPMSLVSACG